MSETYTPQVECLHQQYVATYREFPGVRGFADTRQEAIDAAKESLDGLIKAYKRNRLPLPAPMPTTGDI